MQSFNRLMGMLVTMAAVSYTTLAEQPDVRDKANAAQQDRGTANAPVDTTRRAALPLPEHRLETDRGASRAPNSATHRANALLNVKEYPAPLRALEKRISERRVLVESHDPPVHDECSYAVSTDIEPEHALDEHSIASSRPRVDPAFRTADGAEVPAAGFGASCPSTT